MRGSKGQAYTIPPTDKVALSGRVGFHLINPTAACFELFPRNTNRTRNRGVFRVKEMGLETVRKA